MSKSPSDNLFKLPSSNTLTSYAEKIISREAAQMLSEKTRSEGKTVVYTSGAFDLVHQGHVDYLSRARALGDLLIIGVNTDASVRAYKSPLRPIQKQEQRVHVLAALGFVDAVFTFEETNNNRNIELLKPHIYAKAGDYSKQSLSSAPIVEAYGGKVELLPFVGDFSSSAIIETIVERYGTSPTVLGEVPRPASPQKAIFFDRDGTIVELVEYLHEIEKVKFIPGAIDALKTLHAKGYRLIMNTNQPGIGVGYFTKEDFYRTNKFFLKSVGKSGAKIDKVIVCPHSEAAGCECRKPKIALVEVVIDEMNIDRSQSYFIGDSTSDIEAGRRAGLKTILVKTGEGGRDGKIEVTADFVIEDFSKILTVIE